ncbi:MAG: hypothetical protein ACRCRZ_00090 [Metamycoplasmataceae bacterium]
MKKVQTLWYKTGKCEKCKQETGATYSLSQKIIIYICFLFFLIPGIIAWIIIKPKSCKCCGAIYNKTNFPQK